ncbi:hypothetical protein LX77_03411 [Gelidibacter algens]|jgi:hypothetical protein|uniref:Uncharacterized protein n=1 Tax=Gelidibacter algens TaxID=49280 RepID=A0A1A7QZ41_9FLAO|nr:hypothetical protein [Gelidibacter algens]OBX24538.1 hypothetical protein A9996_14785 [Gelidibacter algens]RAJ19781.1 hypothetical protein LX77_03411 [Gelidibacter algens]
MQLKIKKNTFKQENKLNVMKEKENQENLSKREADKKSKKNFPGYPHYPASEDIYNKEKEVTDINPADITKTKTTNEKRGHQK